VADPRSLWEIPDVKPAPVRPLDWPLVGRESQLQLAADALANRSGVVVHGAAGVGKTRPRAGDGPARASRWSGGGAGRGHPCERVHDLRRVRPSAGVEANRIFDHDLAAQLASEALAAGAGAAAALPLATAHARRNRFAAAEEALAPWEPGLAALPEAFDFLQLRVVNLRAGLGRTSEATALLDRAARWRSGPWQQQVEALRVLLLFDEGRLGAAAALGRPLVAGGTGDPRTVSLAGGPTSLALVQIGATREAEALADLLEQNAASGAAEARWAPVQAWVAARLRSGRGWDELEARIAALHAEAFASGDEVLAGLAEMTLGRIALTNGRLDVSVRWLREAAAHLEEADPRRALVPCLAMLTTAHALRGEIALAEAARARADAAATVPRIPWWGLIEVAVSDVWLAAARGELTRARRSGAGASEASMVGLLVLVHIDPATAAAAALCQRVLTTGVAAAIGGAAYLLARRRFELGSLLTVRAKDRPDADARPPALRAAA
jgi:hypothetical protein